MTTIQFASDLHLEFPENSKYLKRNPLKPMAEVLVLAGDILPFVLLNNQMDFWKYVSDHYHTTYWLPGNHEYYHVDISQKNGFIDEQILENVFLVNNTTKVWKDCQLIFSTMWTKIGTQHQFAIQNALSDFHLVKNGRNRFSTSDYNQLHEKSKSFLVSALQSASQGRKLVFTHHVPTFMNYPPQYRGSVLNEGFAVEMHDFIESSGADFWIYGHSHANTLDFTIGNTTLCTNQLGYVRQNEHQSFRHDVVMVLDAKT